MAISGKQEIQLTRIPPLDGILLTKNKTFFNVSSPLVGEVGKGKIEDMPNLWH